MCDREHRDLSSYQLRYAAGIYWLLDMSQSGIPYRKPLALNEVGARIWSLYAQGGGEDEIAEELCAEYRVERDLILEDMAQFRSRLEQYGIRLYGEGETI